MTEGAARGQRKIPYGLAVVGTAVVLALAMAVAVFTLMAEIYGYESWLSGSTKWEIPMFALAMVAPIGFLLGVVTALERAWKT